MIKILFTYVIFLITLALSHPSNSPNSKELADGNTLALQDMTYTLADSSGVIVTAYDFGEGDLKNSAGKQVPCPLDGIIAAPGGSGQYPLVIIFHGVTRVKNVYDKIYSGFDYLVAQLAAEGYVAVSFNVNIEYHCWDYGESRMFDWGYQVYKQQIALLQRANNGEEYGHGVDLQGKIDFSQIHLIGHSCGGELADLIIRKERDEGLNRIRSLVRVEATTLIYDDPFPDVPTGIIIGEFDGDVPETGQYVFDELQREQGRVSPASIVYLRGANHAFFNRCFITDEARSQRNRLTRGQQEDFLTRYACAFLSVYAKGQAPGRFNRLGIWDLTEPQPVTMFGYAVTASSLTPERLTLVSPTPAGLPRLDSGSAVSVTFISKTSRDGVWFRHPGASYSACNKLPLYAIRWNGGGGTVSFNCNKDRHIDFSAYSALSLFVAVDSSDDLNPKGEAQSFIVSLMDESGAKQNVLIPKGTSALAYHDGRLVEIKEFDGRITRYWDGYMPLGDLRIPLSYFDGINLNAVTELLIELNQTDSGAVMLSGIYLVK
jgi:dienelactone hydrolase